MIRLGKRDVALQYCFGQPSTRSGQTQPQRATAGASTAASTATAFLLIGSS